jgi:hypothetical protein
MWCSPERESCLREMEDCSSGFAIADLRPDTYGSAELFELNSVRQYTSIVLYEVANDGGPG